MAKPRSDNSHLESLAGFGGRISEKVMTFAGGTTNDPGDFDGTGNPATLFTVTGSVAVKLLAYVQTTLTGASATVEVGTAITTIGLIPLTTGTGLAAGEIWHDASPDASIELSTVLTEKIVSQNIIQTVRTANVTAGKIKYVLFWKPLSEDANVVAA